MATLKQQLLTKIASMRTACYNACSACKTLSNPQGDVLSRNAYNNSFDHLVTAINNYFTNPLPTYWGTNNWNKYQQNLYDIITFDFIREMTSAFVYDPPYNGYPTTDLPTGEDDYWKLFGISTFATDFLNRNNNYYYVQGGCIVADPLSQDPPPTTIAPIEQDATMITTTLPVNDLNLQNTFVSWLKYYSQRDQLINVIEDMQIVGEVPIIHKSDIGTLIYITKHAKDIIESFGFDIYIPTYVRGS